MLLSISMDMRLRRRALAAGFDDTLLSEDMDAAEIAALPARLAEATLRTAAD